MTQFRFSALLALLALAVGSPLLSQDNLKKVDINRASTAQLQGLPGIGPALAQRIVDHRSKNGPFKRIQDLLNVPGIGQKKFQKLEALVTVSVASAGRLEGPLSKGIVEGEGSQDVVFPPAIV